MSKTWTTADGRKIPIAKMDDNHLLNTVQMIDRRTRAGVFNLLLKEPRVLDDLLFARGDRDRVPRKLVELYYEMLPKVFDDLVAELRWRQIAIPAKLPEIKSAKAEALSKTIRGSRADLMILDDVADFAEAITDIKIPKYQKQIMRWAARSSDQEKLAMDMTKRPKKQKAKPISEPEPPLRPRSRRFRGEFL